MPFRIYKNKKLLFMNTISILTQDFAEHNFNRLFAEISELKAQLKSVQFKEVEEEYYRNKDLKRKFKFSDNTIIHYREANILPYTIIGDIYCYPVSKINKILKNNSNYIK